MKSIYTTVFLVLSALCFNFAASGQTTVSAPANIPAIAFHPTDQFFYSTSNWPVGNYSLGFYQDPALPGAATSYLSGFNGIKFFTTASPRMFLSSGGYLGVGTLNPVSQLHVDPQGPGGILIGNGNLGSGGYTSLSIRLSAQQNGYTYL